MIGSLIFSLTLGFTSSLQAEPPFEQDIKRFEAADAKSMPPRNGIVFVGSSSIVLWKTLATDFPGHNVINRGFGGSQISDSLRNVHRIVTPYRPKLIVFFAGTNDVAAGKKPEEIAGDFRRFVGAVRSKLPATRIIFISLTPAPSRWSMVQSIKKVNSLVRDFCHNGQNLVFLDMFSQFLDDKGQPRPELFVADQLHMNPKGYAIWKANVKPLLPWGGSGSSR